MNTIASLQDKTPEELNVELAELLGFVRSTTHKFSLYGLCEINQEATDPVPAFTKDGRWYRPNTLPPYATSYDAIMGEVLKLDDEQHALFTVKLHEVCSSDAEVMYFVPWHIARKMAKPSPADLTRALILVLQSK